jgi:hypothetical protein
VRGDGAHRRFGEAELAAVTQAMELERRLDVSPAELAFGLRVLSEPAVAQAVRELGLRIGRIQTPRRALDFEKEKALRLLRDGGPGTTRPGRGGGGRRADRSQE